jgi:hypothetical protein
MPEAAGRHSAVDFARFKVQFSIAKNGDAPGLRSAAPDSGIWTLKIGIWTLSGFPGGGERSGRDFP